MDEALRRRVRQRAGERCEYCRLGEDQAPFAAFHVEHIVPRKHGGRDATENLALACQHCNWHKGTNLSGVDPDTGRVTRLFNPRTDAWATHFRFDGARIEGLTDMGRTSVAVLNMNEPERVELRSEIGNE